MAYVLGIDVGGTNLVAGCVAEDGSRLEGLLTEPTRAEQQHPGLEQLLLPLVADLGQQQVARVAVALRVGELRRRLDWVAHVFPAEFISEDEEPDEEED